MHDLSICVVLHALRHKVLKSIEPHAGDEVEGVLIHVLRLVFSAPLDDALPHLFVSLVVLWERIEKALLEYLSRNGTTGSLIWRCAQSLVAWASWPKQAQFIQNLNDTVVGSS